MALPKQRHTRQRRDRARKELELTLVNTQACPKCKARVLAHHACPECGTYKGKEVKNTTPKLKTEKKAAK